MFYLHLFEIGRELHAHQARFEKQAGILLQCQHTRILFEPSSENTSFEMRPIFFSLICLLFEQNDAEIHRKNLD